MIKKVKLAAIFIFICNFAFGWGGKGHDIVAEIATRHLTPKAKKEINRIFEGRSLVFYSVLMDDIRYDDEYKYTATWHYVNLNEGEEYSVENADPNGDVYTAVELIIDKLEDYKNLSEKEQKFYLAALVHFVGDLHCPMHAGRRDDKGGNLTNVFWFGRSTNLHSVWDSAFIERVRPWSYSEWADNIDYQAPKYIFSKYCQSEPSVWLEETVDAASEVYDAYTPGVKYSYDYMGDFFPLLEEQLLKAGYRLASVLNSVF